MTGFDPERYWIDRHARLAGDPRAVGRIGDSRVQVEAGTASLQAELALALRIAGPVRSVLDMGCGTGRAAPVFVAAGIDYLGIDVSPVAIATAQAAAPSAAPGAAFRVGSALEVDWGPPRDMVAVIYVFLHVVDDGAWRRLIARIAEFLPPGGALLFADEMPALPDRPAPHVARRPLSAYAREFDRVGLALDVAFSDVLAMGPLPGTEEHLFLARKRRDVATDGGEARVRGATLTPGGPSGMADGFRTGGP